MSLPGYFIALILILVFAITLKWVPIAGFTVNVLESPLLATRNLIMPTASLSADYVALIARLTRSSMLEVLREDYVRTARAKGLREWNVIMKHALRNALIPIITMASINFVYLLGGTIILEEIFALPGIGRLLIEAVNNRDFPIIQGITLMIGIFFIIVNFITDMIYTIIDPRIRT
jgi:peptide/nickel transport system permease protein